MTSVMRRDVIGVDPPQSVIDAVLAPTTRVTSRIEIYEEDATTRWEGDDGERLITGSVTADYSRDERRGIDLTLANQDGRLLNAPGSFWYDKIIKAYKGVLLNENLRASRVIIIGSTGTTLTANFREMLAAFGFDDVRVNLLATTVDELAGYEIVVSLGGGSAFPNSTLINDAYAAGYAVFTEGDGTTSSQLSFATSQSANASRSTWLISPNTSLTHPLVYGWVAETFASAFGTLITGISAEGVAVSQVTIDAISNYTIIGAENPNSRGGKWVHFHPNLFVTANTTAFLHTAMNWLTPYVPIGRWETQVGEFMIDQISEENFPLAVAVTGRDYAKKCLSAKFVEGVQFATGNTLEYNIAALSAQAGITKKILPVTGITVDGAFAFERGVTRWKAITDMAGAYNYDAYFDRQGYLRLVPFQDPANSPTAYTFKTGQDGGNLASYGKSTNDSRLYNHVVVIGGSADSTVLPPWAEAKNEDPNSPTSIEQIGDRLYEYASTFLTTTPQCQAVADKFLAVHSLEEFNLNFSSISAPWLEVGTISSFEDPRPAPGDATRFLLQSLSLPLNLGPMSGTAGRVTAVG